MKKQHLNTVANEGETVGDYAWTIGKIPPNGNINTMLVNIGMTGKHQS